MGGGKLLKKPTEQKQPSKALIKGRVVEYDAASPTEQFTSQGRWEYLGVGTIHSIAGVAQANETEFHFWVRM
ncbi:MAG: hypothetical protein AAGA46_00115 [Cyanobacteria bacterium P01_F01_bin.13]